MYRETAIPGLGTLWVSDPSGAAARIPADGCADIILRDDELIVAGPSTRWLLARGGAHLPTVGLRFAPGLAGTVFAVDPSAVQDRIVLAQDLLPVSLRRRGELALRSLLAAGGSGEAACADDPGAFRRAARTIPRELDLDPDAADLRWASEIRGAARRGEPFAQLADRLGYSERHLRRRVLRSFGYGYAALRRVLRAARAGELIRTETMLAEVAQLAGYADQPHMTREFKRVIGATPAQLAVSVDEASGAYRSIELPSGSSTVE
ncbi:helix-turn-helix transcriptional regulator [Leucobacter celer]|uniref:helix-turn-helix transcriptional regulator n=1 Tax=Leucobacter celer TaxID=668625 RepID=UPI0006A7CAE7|nr:helix-turn-helix transcriptional regulator [Leucobacter celer]